MKLCLNKSSGELELRLSAAHLKKANLKHLNRFIAEHYEILREEVAKIKAEYNKLLADAVASCTQFAPEDTVCLKGMPFTLRVRYVHKKAGISDSAFISGKPLPAVAAFVPQEQSLYGEKLRERVKAGLIKSPALAVLPVMYEGRLLPSVSALRIRAGVGSSFKKTVNDFFAEDENFTVPLSDGLYKKVFDLLADECLQEFCAMRKNAEKIPHSVAELLDTGSVPSFFSDPVGCMLQKLFCLNAADSSAELVENAVASSASDKDLYCSDEVCKTVSSLFEQGGGDGCILTLLNPLSLQEEDPDSFLSAYADVIFKDRSFADRLRNFRKYDNMPVCEMLFLPGIFEISPVFTKNAVFDSEEEIFRRRMLFESLGRRMLAERAAVFVEEFTGAVRQSSILSEDNKSFKGFKLVRQEGEYTGYEELQGVEGFKSLEIDSSMTALGCCTHIMGKGAFLTLNSSLMHLPDSLLQYVVAHECAHLIHRRHGQQFRVLLHRLLPFSERLKELCVQLSYTVIPKTEGRRRRLPSCIPSGA